MGRAADRKHPAFVGVSGGISGLTGPLSRCGPAHRYVLWPARSLRALAFEPFGGAIAVRGKVGVASVSGWEHLAAAGFERFTDKSIFGRLASLLLTAESRSLG